MLGTLYRAINQSMVDTEKLLTLLNEPTEVNDKPGAPDLVVTDGAITFGMYQPVSVRNVADMSSFYREGLFLV